MGNQKVHMTHFITIFALLQGPGTEPTVSPRCACTWQQAESPHWFPHLWSEAYYGKPSGSHENYLHPGKCTRRPIPHAQRDRRDQRHHRGLKRCSGAEPTSLFNPHSLQKTGGSWRMTFVVQSLCRIRLFATPWTAAHQASLSSISQSLLKLMSITSVMRFNHLLLCHPLLLLPSIFPTIRIFSNESALCIRWPKYWNFSFSISPSNEYSGLISFRIDWFDLFAVQGILKSLLQRHSSKASILWHSTFFMVQLSHPYITGKIIALTIRTFVSKVIYF